jgi:Uma2 family endonuclease
MNVPFTGDLENVSMSTVATKTRYTPEDLLTMPDGDRYELVDGELRDRKMSRWSSFVAGRIYNLLMNYSETGPFGWVFPEGTSYQCFPDAPEKVRKADVSFIARERLPLDQATDEGHTSLAPDLAVEVLSPNDLAYEVDRKVQEYLTARVRLVWVVNPETRTVAVYRLDGTVSRYGERDEITGEDVLPGFRCPVAAFFRLPTGSAAPAPPTA